MVFLNSSFGAWREIASVICNCRSASSRILSTSPQVDTVIFLALICSPLSELINFKNCTTFWKLSIGSPEPIMTMLSTRSPEIVWIRYIWSNISDGARLRTMPSSVDAQKRQPMRQPTCEEIHTELPWWYVPSICDTCTRSAVSAVRRQFSFNVFLKLSGRFVICSKSVTSFWCSHWYTCDARNFFSPSCSKYASSCASSIDLISINSKESYFTIKNPSVPSMPGRSCFALPSRINGKFFSNHAAFSSFSGRLIVHVLYTSVPPGFTYSCTTVKISRCNDASCSIFSTSVWYLISGFLPIMPSPEHGRSASTISALSFDAVSETLASHSFTEMLSSPSRAIFSRISCVFNGVKSLASTLPSVSFNATFMLFPPGAAHTSIIRSCGAGDASSPASMELMSCTKNSPRWKLSQASR